LKLGLSVNLAQHKLMEPQLDK